MSRPTRIITTDLPPPPPDLEAGPRPTTVHLLPQDVHPEDLAGGIAIVIDALRASVTILTALAVGATRVIPVLTVQHALDRKRAIINSGELEPILGGERGGVRPEGFHLGNSPAHYTRELLAGKTCVFSSTNGTGSLLHAAAAARVLAGCMPNRAAVCDAVADDERPVHIICAGTREQHSMEDALVAGAMIDRLLERGRTLTPDDASRMVVRLWRSASAEPRGVESVFRASRGGRNLVRLKLDADITICAAVDTSPLVPEFHVSDGEIRIASLL